MIIRLKIYSVWPQYKQSVQVLDMDTHWTLESISDTSTIAPNTQQTL